jgi:hypothetical protein
MIPHHKSAYRFDPFVNEVKEETGPPCGYGLELLDNHEEEQPTRRKPLKRSMTPQNMESRPHRISGIHRSPSGSPRGLSEKPKKARLRRASTEREYQVAPKTPLIEISGSNPESSDGYSAELILGSSEEKKRNRRSAKRKTSRAKSTKKLEAKLSEQDANGYTPEPDADLIGGYGPSPSDDEDSAPYSPLSPPLSAYGPAPFGDLTGSSEGEGRSPEIDNREMESQGISGDVSDPNAGYSPDPTSESGPDPTSGYGPDPTSGYGPDPNSGYTAEPSDEGEGALTSGYGPDPNSGYTGEPSDEGEVASGYGPDPSFRSGYGPDPVNDEKFGAPPTESSSSVSADDSPKGAYGVPPTGYGPSLASSSSSDDSARTSEKLPETKKKKKNSSKDSSDTVDDLSGTAKMRPMLQKKPRRILPTNEIQKKAEEHEKEKKKVKSRDRSQSLDLRGRSPEKQKKSLDPVPPAVPSVSPQPLMTSPTRRSPSPSIGRAAAILPLRAAPKKTTSSEDERDKDWNSEFMVRFFFGFRNPDLLNVAETSIPSRQH